MRSEPNNSLSNGVYNITIDISNTTQESIRVYCIFDYNNNSNYNINSNYNYNPPYAWTLIEYGTLINMKTVFAFASFYLSYTSNDDNFNFGITSFSYRINYDRINSIQQRSQYLFGTCNFNTSFIKDYILFDLKTMDYDPFTGTSSGKCVKVKDVNIRGFQCNDNTQAEVATVALWDRFPSSSGHGGSNIHLHVDSSSNGGINGTNCSCSGWISSAVDGEDNFGYYAISNSEFGCAKDMGSSTNWWLGSQVRLNDDHEYDYQQTSMVHVPTVPPSVVPSTSLIGEVEYNNSSFNISTTGDKSMINDDYNTSYSGIEMMLSTIETTLGEIVTNINNNSIFRTTGYNYMGGDGNGNGEKDGLLTFLGMNDSIIIFIVSGLFLLCCFCCILIAWVSRYYIDKKFAFEKSQQQHTQGTKEHDHEQNNNISNHAMTTTDLEDTNINNVNSNKKSNNNVNNNHNNKKNNNYASDNEMNSIMISSDGHAMESMLDSLIVDKYNLSDNQSNSIEKNNFGNIIAVDHDNDEFEDDVVMELQSIKKDKDSKHNYKHTQNINGGAAIGEMRMQSLTVDDIFSQHGEQSHDHQSHFKGSHSDIFSEGPKIVSDDSADDGDHDIEEMYHVFKPTPQTQTQTQKLQQEQKQTKHSLNKKNIKSKNKTSLQTNQTKKINKSNQSTNNTKNTTIKSTK